MVIFEHEKLDIYRVAIQFADAADVIASDLPTGHSHVRDQLRRASDSVVNNIAEGAGEFRPREKARFYRIALRSGTEAAAVLHTCMRRGLSDATSTDAARGLLKRVVEMLTKMILAARRRELDRAELPRRGA